MVAGFKGLLKTNITNISNSVTIVLLSYNVVAWWQDLGIFKKQTSQRQVIVSQ